VELISPGHYARKQLLSPSALVRWSHGSRFRVARRLVMPYAGRRLLDYGCGDGTFLALVADLFPDAVGADIDPQQIADCAARFGGAPRTTFLTMDRLADPSQQSRYDVVVCMEVLEHCPDDVQPAALDAIGRLVAPGGVILISVPVEIGPPVLAKQCARALVAIGGLREYATRERYRPGEIVRMVLARAETRFPRQEYPGTGPEGRAIRFTGHKGFNWRALGHLLEDRFLIGRRLFSPLPIMGPWLNSQVWFVCRKK
jgi:2-polyprenyl-3-methyl-5-hydroxy-6-metoxy-1,4-benzoquinol methylase